VSLVDVATATPIFLQLIKQHENSPQEFHAYQLLYMLCVTKPKEMGEFCEKIVDTLYSTVENNENVRGNFVLQKLMTSSLVRVTGTDPVFETHESSDGEVSDFINHFTDQISYNYEVFNQMFKFEYKPQVIDGRLRREKYHLKIMRIILMLNYCSHQQCVSLLIEYFGVDNYRYLFLNFMHSYTGAFLTEIECNIEGWTEEDPDYICLVSLLSIGSKYK